MDQKLFIEGYILPDLYEKFKKQNKGLIVDVSKGADKSQSFIAINEQGKFRANVWLVFGPGEYEVSIGLESEMFSQRTNITNKFYAYNTGSDIRNLAPSKGIPCDDPQIISLAKEITKNKSTEKEKAKAVYEWVCKNISYDDVKSRAISRDIDDDALKTLELRKGVCQDYAHLTVALLRAIGIEARTIHGKTMNDGKINPRGHAWTEAKIDGKWLVMDTTWGAGHVELLRFVPDYKEEYFDPNPEEFAKTHIWEEVYY